jgi:hypothetical protein
MMKSIAVKLKIDQEKYRAACQFMEEKGLDMEAELSAEAARLYQKNVPAVVRKYIEKSSPASNFGTSGKPSRASASPGKPASRSPASTQNSVVSQPAGSKRDETA